MVRYRTQRSTAEPTGRGLMATMQSEASPQEQAILVKLLEACQPPLESVDRARFRATSEAFDELDRLEHDRYVIQDGGIYRVSVTALSLLRSDKAQRVLRHAESVWVALRAHYKEHQFAQIQLLELAERSSMSIADLREALVYMLELSWSSGRSNDLSLDDATIGAGEEVARCPTFQAYLNKCLGWYRNPISTVLKSPQLAPRVAFDLPDWVDQLPHQIAEVMRQTYQGLRDGLTIPGAIGLRTLIDATAQHALGGDPGTFKQMLGKLEASGLLPPADRDLLSRVIDSGNAVAHRAYKPDPESLRYMKDATEHLMVRVFLSAQRAQHLFDRTPQRS
jgi:hypothetical protein